MLPLLTRDPASGGRLIATRLECPESGVAIEGNFSLGWVGLLTPQQVELAGLWLKNRGNVQKLAAELGVAYNTARSRTDEIVTALGGPAEAVAQETRDRAEVLERVARGEITPEDAVVLLRDVRT